MTSTAHTRGIMSWLREYRFPSEHTQQQQHNFLRRCWFYYLTAFELTPQHLVRAHSTQQAAPFLVPSDFGSRNNVGTVCPFAAILRRRGCYYKWRSGQLLHHSTCRPPVQRWSGRASTCGTLHFGCSNKTLPQICSGTATATGVTTTMQPQPCVLWLVSIIVRICVANHCLICAARFFVPIRLT